MAALWRTAGQRISAAGFSNRVCLRDPNIVRCLGTSSIVGSSKAEPEPVQDSGGWFKNLLNVRTITPSKESHSSQLASKETVYELQIHCVKPECMEEYLKDFGNFQQLMHDKKTGSSLIGSFTVEIGDQDQAIHIWSYSGGYPVLNNANAIYRTDKDFIDLRIRRNKMLRSRSNQIMLAFSFWPDPEPRPPKNIYELRSYVLKPGTMIEWGNNWARGIQHRRSNNEAVAGYFSQIGELTSVQHLFGYKDLQTRKEIREAAWLKPGWDECVAYTVPLIRHMQSRILIPTPFSPLQ